MIVRGADRAVRRLTDAAESLQGRGLQAAVTTAARRIEAAARANAPVDSGRLRASLKTEMRRERGLAGGQVTAAVGSSLAYAPAVERGTLPHWVAVRQVTAWAARRGISPYAVQRAIARRGTRPHPFLKPALDEQAGRLTAEVRAAIYREVER